MLPSVLTIDSAAYCRSESHNGDVTYAAKYHQVEKCLETSTSENVSCL